MSDRTGLSRGDRNRNVRLARLRQLLPPGDAIVGIDLADVKQAAVVTDHDSRVLARRRVTARAWELGELLDWAVARAPVAGAGPARRGAGACAGVRAAAAGLPGPRERGPDPG